MAEQDATPELPPQPPANTTHQVQDDLSAFLGDPNIRQAVADALKNLTQLQLDKEKNTAAHLDGDRKAAFLLTALVSTLILAAVIYAGQNKIVSAETVAVVFGGVVAGAFAFLGDYFTADD